MADYSRADQENKEGGSYSRRDLASPAGQAPGSSRASRRSGSRGSRSGALALAGEAIASPRHGEDRKRAPKKEREQMGKYNSNEELSQTNLAPQQRQGHASPGRYRPQLGQKAPQARKAAVEMKEMSQKVAPERNEQASTISAEDQTVRDQIEQIVRKQLAAQDAQDKLIGRKPQNQTRPKLTVGALVDSELELLKKQMS